jgi:hypothetical protein
MSMRYEILPFGSGEDEAQAQATPLVIAVTCSPRHGVDQTVDVVTTAVGWWDAPVSRLR